MHNIFFDWFSIDLPLFVRAAFRFAFGYKKMQWPCTRKFSNNTLFNLVQLIHNYTPDWRKYIPRKFLKNDKLFNLETYCAKLKIPRLILLKLSVKNLLYSLKWRLDLFKLKRICVKIKKKIMSRKTKLRHVPLFCHEALK